VKFTFSWLTEHLETEAAVPEIVDRLTMLGLEVGAAVDRAEGLRGFTVGRVVEAKPHPDADRLQVCTVDTGSGTIDVVCGAPNARTGMKGVFAPVGSFVPGVGSELKKTKIRGVESSGMLLSEREMNISDDHDGIVDLPADAEVGAPAVAAMGLDDTVFDIDITPNRGDCLGVRGIARDLAAAGLGKLKPLDAQPVAGAFESPIGVHLDLDGERADACPYFVGRYLRGVTNANSPKWLRDKLLGVGLRPISALVDITNLMTIGLNRPLHAFDADKVRGDIHVRMARPGEKLLALNEKEYELDSEMTAIADEAAAAGLGGIMGGKKTGCAGDTVNVFLESALFDPLRTAATGRKLNLISDARYRFERGIDPTFLEDGMEIATRLILDLCGGEPSELVIAGAAPAWQRAITLRPDRVQSLGGVDVARPEIERILTDLGFELSEEGSALAAQVPPWRGDIVGEACLVEEVVRIHGYDRVPAVPLANTTFLPRPALNLEQRRHARARRALAARGLTEAITYSFMPSAQAALFGGVPDTLRLVNPISSDLDVMRPSILPNLIAACGRNADRGIADAALFEVGPQYAGDRVEDQTAVAAGVRTGDAVTRNWAAATRAVDAFDAKADVMAVLDALDVTTKSVHVTADAPAWYHPGRSGMVRLGPKTVLARFGEIHPAVLRAMDVKVPAAGFEILLSNLPRLRAKKSAPRPHLELSPYQAVERDFAFVVDAGVSAGAVLGAVRAADKTLIAEVCLFDVYAGAGVDAGKKSLAVSVTLRPEEKTLTDAEIDAVAKKVVASVEKATGGILRT